MIKKIIKPADQAAKRQKPRKTEVERGGKDIEYIYIFSPRENGTDFYALCTG